MGTLYVVSTPIGNLADITLRALETLRSASLIVAEDTRRTRKLLSHYEIHRPLLSLNEHSPPERLRHVLAATGEGNVALVTDAGTPLVSDPGMEAVTAAIAAGIPIAVVPGASAVLAALVLSGLPADSFTFVGFLPRKRAEREGRLAELCALTSTLIFYEAPHRLVATLEALHGALGDRRVAVCRELTKLHEEVRRSTLSEALTYWRETAPRGEYTLVVAGAEPLEEPAAAVEPGEALAEIAGLAAAGVRPSEAVRAVAERRGLDRRELYRRWAEHRPDSGAG